MDSSLSTATVYDCNGSRLDRHLIAFLAFTVVTNQTHGENSCRSKRSIVRVLTTMAESNAPPCLENFRAYLGSPEIEKVQDRNGGESIPLFIGRRMAGSGDSVVHNLFLNFGQERECCGCELLADWELEKLSKSKEFND